MVTIMINDFIHDFTSNQYCGCVPHNKFLELAHTAIYKDIFFRKIMKRTIVAPIPTPTRRTKVITPLLLGGILTFINTESIAEFSNAS